MQADMKSATLAVIALGALSMLSSVRVLAADAIEDKAAVCAGCHGDKGVPIDEITPILWGLPEGYIYLQLRDFKSGARKFDTMNAIVAEFTKDDLKALAAYFAAKPWPDLQQPSASKDVAAKAIAANVSVGCTGCHLGEYQGDMTVPRLAGQQRAYLEKTMKDFRVRSRGNNPGMSDLMNATPEDDLAALAEYLAGMQLSGGTTHGSR